jgi:lipopolysaccharide biosynthesis glycosyltransferase
MFFFSSPEPVFEELGENSILIIPHRFSDNNKHNKRFGIYNVGFLSFRNDEWGRKCLEWWRNKCIEWCYDREEANRFADQKYLDYWPSLFEKVCELTHKGTNLAPWNIDNFKYKKNGESILVDDDKLIIYHFNSLNKKSSALYDIGTRVYGSQLSDLLLVNVYKVYINKIEAITRTMNLNVGENRCKQRYSTFIRNMLAIAETEEAIFFSKYFRPIRLSQLLRPISSVKNLVKKKQVV